MTTTQAVRPIPVTPESGNNMILGAGVSFFDIDLDGVTNGISAAEFLKIMNQWERDGKGFGATTGDPVLTIGRGVTRIQTNDLHVDVKGMFDSRGSGSVTLGFTVQELASEEAWKRILATTFDDPVDGSLRIGTVLKSEHYKNIAYVNMANNGDLVLFVLLNAIPTEDTVATFSNTVGTSAGVPVVFTATLSSLEEMQTGALPYKQFRFPFASTSTSGTAAALTSEAEIKDNKSEKADNKPKKGYENV